MKIRHNITRNGCELRGRILETIFENGEYRGGCKNIYSKDEKFFIESHCCPQLFSDCLFVWGNRSKEDNKEVSCTYKSPEEAQKILDYINEFSVEGFVRGEEVEVRDMFDQWKPRIYLATIEGSEFPYVVVCERDYDKFKKGEKFYHGHYEQIRKIKPKKTYTLTITEDQHEKIKEILEE